MSTQLLIYETAVPVSSARHRKCAIEPGKGYGFARKINSVPLTAVEFPLAAAEYAIVFAQNGEDVVPVAILGARAGENLYVKDDDSWSARYVPAFVRRYPFVFSAKDDGKSFTLCVDEAFQGLNYQGRGQPLFDEQGKQTAYVDNVVRFLQEFRSQFMRTQAFCRKLAELELLEPMQAQFTLGGGQKMSLTGFHVIDRKKLKALPAETLSQLAGTDELELIYLHLQSMRNFVSVKDKLVLAQPEAGPGDTAPAAEEREAAAAVAH
ncbi:MAG TPA: SapC family protein [Ramlibacter sp.]|uniref:SapC family protein n=1 Tax=Ramlibacter sp. TaxID=1917967 RepID=UPI002ED2D683